MFYYRAFGLNIASEVELPELVEGVLPADIEIHYGNVPSPDFDNIHFCIL
jgi:hypothetical protein